MKRNNTKKEGSRKVYLNNITSILKEKRSMSFTNGEKSKHGKNAQKNIESLLEVCKKNGYIEDYNINYRIGKEGFINSEQFYAPFRIIFKNNKQWVLFSTTSMRTDRIKGQQWDAINIKELNPLIEKVYLVYSDSIEDNEKKLFIKQNQKYIDNVEFSAIDAIINQEKLHSLIENIAHSHLSSGQIKDIQGRNFEERIALILSNPDNLEKYKTNNKTLTGLYFPIFKTIITYLKIIPELIESIHATSNSKIIQKLPSGGNPKTDVLVDIKFTNGNNSIITISCKRSSSKRVSVHEYSAKSFSKILDKDNVILSNLLEQFQETPSLSGFGQKNVAKLTEVLKPYNMKLTKWALAGINGLGNPETQWASHILTYDNNDYSTSFHSIDEYILLLQSKNISGHFGTFFSWTYPSKKRGKSIQLKCKIIK